MCIMTEKEKQLLKIQQMGFMTDDLRLFLDTHPDCSEALCALKFYIAAERELREKYAKKYGPLTLEGIGEGCGYSWICGAWPWEMEA